MKFVDKIALVQNTYNPSVCVNANNNIRPKAKCYKGLPQQYIVNKNADPSLI